MFCHLTHICGQSIRWTGLAAIALAVGQLQAGAQQPAAPPAVKKAAPGAARVTVERRVVEPAAVQPTVVERTVVERRVPAAVVRAAPRGVVVRREFRPAELRAPDLGIWFDPAARDSLLILDVAPGGAIDKLGFMEGDRILALNGVKVRNEADFVKLLFAAERRNQPAEVLLIRKNMERVILVDPAVLEEEYVVVRQDPLEQYGLVVDDRYDDRTVVWKVVPRSPAFYAGFRSGDVVTTFRGQPIVGRKAFVESFTSLEPGPVDVEIRRGERVRALRVELPREADVEPPPVPREVRPREVRPSEVRPREERIDERSDRREERREDRREIQREERREDAREDRLEERREEQREDRRDDRREERRDEGR